MKKSLITGALCAFMLCALVLPSAWAGDIQPAKNAVAAGYNAFGFKLFSALQKADGNTLISPASIAFALAMTCNGAERETRDAMSKVLNLYGYRLQVTNDLNRTLIDSIRKADPKVELAIANAIFCRKDVIIKPEFLKLSKATFGAEISNNMTKEGINGCVSSNTKGKIPTIIERVSSDMAMCLINAVYFKGAWTSKFERRLTEDREFITRKERKKCPMMYKEGTFSYFRGQGFQALELPYGNRKLSMVIILPDKNNGLDRIKKSLTVATWKAWTDNLAPAAGEVFLPRFKTEYSASLVPELKALGMSVAFGPNANFSAMTSESLSIGDVLHKTFIDVNEEGTEAAAATAVTMMRSTSSMAPAEKFHFRADHPFFYAIRDSGTGIILFMGTLQDPKQ